MEVVSMRKASEVQMLFIDTGLGGRLLTRGKCEVFIVLTPQREEAAKLAACGLAALCVVNPSHVISAISRKTRGFSLITWINCLDLRLEDWF